MYNIGHIYTESQEKILWLELEMKKGAATHFFPFPASLLSPGKEKWWCVRAPSSNWSQRSFWKKRWQTGNQKGEDGDNSPS